MSTEVWFRNPHSYIRELVECGEYKIAWDRGVLVKQHVDPIKHASLYFGETYPWRVLAVGPQGTAEYRSGDTWEKPTAVYPTWMYGEDSVILEEMLESPVGQSHEACNDLKCTGDERPIWGQEHRVVITDMPSMNTGTGKRLLRYLKDLQEQYPRAIIHLHGVYGWRTAFGTGLGAADVDPRAAAQKGKVHLPSGSERPYEHLSSHPRWITSLGFKPKDLEVPRNRCMFNIKSAVWAGQFYTDLFKFQTRRSSKPIDTDSSDADYKPPVTASPFFSAVTPQEGDKQVCDTCTLQNECRYFRSGAVCTLPDADNKSLARMFGTRDADLIIDGLGTLMAAGTRRLERGMQWEEVDGEIDPEVTKMINQIFGQGVQLAKLIDPKLRGGTKIGIQVGGGSNVSLTGNSNVLVAGVFRELESQGIPRDQITPEMVQKVLEATAKGEDEKRRALQGTVIEGKVVDA